MNKRLWVFSCKLKLSDLGFWLFGDLEFLDVQSPDFHAHFLRISFSEQRQQAEHFSRKQHSYEFFRAWFDQSLTYITQTRSNTDIYETN